jgi:hypothetical protein
MKKIKIDKDYITLIIGFVILIGTALLRDFVPNIDSTVDILNVIGWIITIKGLLYTM